MRDVVGFVLVGLSAASALTAVVLYVLARRPAAPDVAPTMAQGTQATVDGDAAVESERVAENGLAASAAVDGTTEAAAAPAADAAPVASVAAATPVTAEATAEAPPEASAPVGPPPATPPGTLPVRSRRPAVVLAAVAGVALVAALALLVPPHYTVTLSPGEQVVAAPGSVILATVENTAPLSGTWKVEPTLDGKPIEAVAQKVSGRDTEVIEVALPDDLAAGRHEIVVGGVSLSFKALTPPDFTTGAMFFEPEIAKVGESAAVSVTVHNSGEAFGEYPGDLYVNGRKDSAERPVIQGGSSQTITYYVTRTTAGIYKLKLCDVRGELYVVKPVRPKTGTVIADSESGIGKLQFKNNTGYDCMVLLTDKPKGSAKPTLAFYVRAKDSYTMTGISNGIHFVYYSAGEAWNHLTDDFVDVVWHERFKNPAAFSTSSWTSSYVDWGAWTRYITTHTQYTYWTIRISNTTVWGPKGGVVEVDDEDFPTTGK